MKCPCLTYLEISSSLGLALLGSLYSFSKQPVEELMNLGFRFHVFIQNRNLLALVVLKELSDHTKVPGLRLALLADLCTQECVKLFILHIKGKIK